MVERINRMETIKQIADSLAALADTSKTNADTSHRNSDAIIAISVTQQQLVKHLDQLAVQTTSMAKTVERVSLENSHLDKRTSGEMDAIRASCEETRRETHDYRKQSRSLITQIADDNKTNMTTFTTSLTTISNDFKDALTVVTSRVDILEDESIYRRGQEDTSKGTAKLWQDNWFKLVTLFIVAVPVIAYLYDSVSTKK